MSTALMVMDTGIGTGMGHERYALRSCLGVWLTMCSLCQEEEEEEEEEEHV
jgi:hypothetical protein